jgi:hypothetical protein
MGVDAVDGQATDHLSLRPSGNKGGSFKKFPFFKMITVFLFLPLMLAPRMERSTAPCGPDFPSHEIDLTHWGMEEPSEIGYLSVGIIHKDGGDELIVYDVREKKPSVEEPSESQSRVPPFQGDAFLVDDFQQGGTNSLGGYFSRLVKPPSESRLTVHGFPDGQRALFFSYDRMSSGYTGFWIQLYDFKSPPARRFLLDASPFSYLTFDIRGEEGNEKLTLQMADYKWEKKEDSLEVGDVGRFLPAGRILKSWQRAQIPVREFPKGLDRKTLASLVFLARQGRGKVYIDNVAFTTGTDAQLPQRMVPHIQKSSPHRGMWVWNTGEILKYRDNQTGLVRFARDNGITDIFLQLPYEGQEREGEHAVIWDWPSVRPLLSALHGAKVRVHALDGDPRFALREWHGHIAATIRSIVRFNLASRPEERFDGIRYDNEPYLLPGFAGVRKESLMEQYLDSLRLSKAAAGSGNLEFGVDIPFWFDEKNEFFEPITEFRGRPLAEWVLDIIDNIGIMDYRTESYGPDGIIAHAMGELRYASEREKKVFIGLETSGLPDETILEFGRDQGSSRISLERGEGPRVFLRWFPEGSGPKTGEGLWLFQQNKTFVPSAKLSFFRKNSAELDEVMDQAESEFRKYTAFYGFALHDYESYRMLKQKKGKD